MEAETESQLTTQGRTIKGIGVALALTGGFLMRVLSQGQIDLFELAFAHLIDVDLARFRHMFYDGGVRIVALACRAGGIDKAAFPTVFNLSRKARHRTESLGRLQINEAEDVFGFYTRPTAMGELRTLAAEIRLPLPS